MINPTHIEAYTFFGLEKGPSLLVIGAIHGDETCGSKAIKKINNLISKHDIKIISGRLTMIPTANPLAVNLKSRNGDRNLNRNFYPKVSPKDNEDHLNNILCPIIEQHDIVIDLHSFKIGDKPFALIKSINDDHSIVINISNYHSKLSEKTLASWLGVQTVVGNWTDTYDAGVNKRIKRRELKKDSLKEIKSRLSALNINLPVKIENLVNKEIEQAFKYARGSKFPKPIEAFKGVYASK